MIYYPRIFTVDAHGSVRIERNVPRKMTLLERLDAQQTFLADDAAAEIRRLQGLVERARTPWAPMPQTERTDGWRDVT